jgi:osmotically-inducible protein OsmY
MTEIRRKPAMKRTRRGRRCLQAFLLILIAAPLTGALGGCVSLAVGAGASVATAAAEERGVSGAASDLATAANITALWVKYDAGLVTDLDVSVSEGRALVTGTVPTAKRRLAAIRLTWRAAGVKAVINEIQVRRSAGVSGFARDSWITTRLVSRLSFDRKVSYINYTVETVNRVVYVMGIAQDQDEIDRITDHARDVPYVRRIVSHVRLKNDPPQRSARRVSPATPAIPAKEQQKP